MKKSDILDVQIIQRDYDKKWERIVKVYDHENAYYHQNENGVMETLVPTKWLTTNVYDAMMEVLVGGKQMLFAQNPKKETSVL